MKKIFIIIFCLLTVAGIIGQTLQKQEKEYHGTVVDDSAKPIYGAAVSIKNSVRGTTTDNAGKFSIMADEKSILIVHAIGYEPAEVAVRALSNPVVLIKVIPNAVKNKSLNEVAIKSYGSQKQAESVVNMQAPSAPYAGYINHNTEGYAYKEENGFKRVKDNPLSTFSLDVDAASYGNVRRFINQGQWPATGSVRVEEMINYFSYNYPQPATDAPFSIHTEYATAPWNKQHGLLMVNLQGKKIPADNLPASNLVFLIDVSGSMMSKNKLPLVQASMKLLVDNLRAKDKVTIITYAGNTAVVLPPTSGAQKTKIKSAINVLTAGGSTNGSAAIQLAYKAATDNFVKGGNNRIILCTDGDFNVGQTSDAALEKLIEQQRKTGVYLTVLGYGMGNYKDDKMQILAQKGNGNHAYIDGMNEAKKVLVNEFGSTLFTIAKDVKFQLEFNPALIQGYRLVGYESRLLNNEDFNDDKKDAGEMGSGHTVTAFYEIIPAGIKTTELKDIDNLHFQNKAQVKNNMDDIAIVKLRYKAPDSDESMLISKNIGSKKESLENASENFRFASAVAGFGQILNNSEYKGIYTFDQAWQQANKALGKDEEGYRYEFTQLIQKAKSLPKQAHEEHSSLDE